MKLRTVAIARGQLRPKGDEPNVWFTSTESFAKVAGPKKMLIFPMRRLKAVLQRHSESSLASLTHWH